MPVPIATPTPNTVSCNAPSDFFSWWPGSVVSAMDCSTVFTRNAATNASSRSGSLGRHTLAAFCAGMFATIMG